MPTLEHDILLSMVVPAVRQGDLGALFASLEGMDDSRLEIVIVNQSGMSLAPKLRQSTRLPLNDHQLSQVIPAAAARNVGAGVARGRYLFFLDDDAVFASDPDALAKLLSQLEAAPPAVIVQRGEFVEGRYCSHWPIGVSELDFRNFPRLVIEWNLIISTELFIASGGFPEIGTGSAHAAQSGEAFVLVARLLARGKQIRLVPEVRVAHPSLFGKPKSLGQALGYAYGAGYAVGMGLRDFGRAASLYWTLRAIGAAFRELLPLGDGNHIKVKEPVDPGSYRRSLASCRLLGFWDAVRQHPPRPRSYLEHEARGVLHLGPLQSHD